MSPAGTIVPATEAGIRLVAEVIAHGEPAIIPTDTVYGVAALPTADGARSLFEAKGRPESRAIPLLLSGLAVLPAVVSEWPPVAQSLADAFWPGALTIVVPAALTVPSEITGGEATVGVRIPSSDIARAVIRRACGCLAVTSANRSGDPPAATAAAALAALDPRVRYALDGGLLAQGVPSTVLQVARERVTVLRKGAICPSAIRAALEQRLPGIQIALVMDE